MKMKKIKEMWNNLSKKGKIASVALIVIAALIIYNWVF
jgi:flagellar biosynthesis/type III secretory pathway M-ring protein FliF/YscJ